MKAYLIPGWGETLKDRDYNSVLKVYKAAGYNPEFIPIHWNYKTIVDWVEQVKEKIPRELLQKSLLSGFSFGAMTSFVLAAEYATPKKLLLFSLSPYFAEDIPLLKDSWLKAVGKRRTENFKKLSIELGVKIESPTLIFAGTAESHNLKQRAQAANRIIKHSKRIMVKDAKHDVADPKYVEAIKEALK